MAEKKDDTEETVTVAKAAKATAKKAPAKDTKSAAEKAPAKAVKKPVAVSAAAKKAAAAAAELGHGGTLRVHHLRPAPGAKTAKMRVGRGEGSKGKTAGRGTKGQKARYQIPERFEGGQMPLHMRLPKLRGFRNPFRVEFQIVNMDKLSELYPTGGEVTIDDLVAKGAVRKGKPVKVLGNGELSVKLTVAVDAYSESAREKILAAGGSISQD
jgi:large subunit ribosomal protein L15